MQVRTAGLCRGRLGQAKSTTRWVIWRWSSLRRAPRGRARTMALRARRASPKKGKRQSRCAAPERRSRRRGSRRRTRPRGDVDCQGDETARLSRVAHRPARDPRHRSSERSGPSPTVSRVTIASKTTPVLFTSASESRDGLTPQHIMSMKVRTKPQSIYFKFQQPAHGREAIYIAGRHGSKVLAHDVGLNKLLAGTLALEPTSSRAMEDCRHPITEAGIGPLLETLAKRWAVELDPEETKVAFRDDMLVGQRRCIDDRDRCTPTAGRSSCTTWSACTSIKNWVCRSASRRSIGPNATVPIPSSPRNTPIRT